VSNTELQHRFIEIVGQEFTLPSWIVDLVGGIESNYQEVPRKPQPEPCPDSEFAGECAQAELACT